MYGWNNKADLLQVMFRKQGNNIDVSELTYKKHNFISYN